MKLSVNGAEIFVATGGREFDPALPTVVLLHGAGFDHTAWALHSRWFAHHGYAVLAPDLPGHGRSDGPGAWQHRRDGRLDRRAARCRRRIQSRPGRPFHGVADRAGDRGAASGAGIGARTDRDGGAMTVGPDLLKAAEANDQAAIDMVSIWGLGFQGRTGRKPRAGAMDAWRCAIACCNIASPASSSAISPPAMPIRTRSPPPRRDGADHAGAWRAGHDDAGKGRQGAGGGYPQCAHRASRRAPAT